MVCESALSDIQSLEIWKASQLKLHEMLSVRVSDRQLLQLCAEGDIPRPCVQFSVPQCDSCVLCGQTEEIFDARLLLGSG